MGKKNFKTSFNDLLGGKQNEEHIAKKETPKETRSTFIIRCDQLDKIKAISYMERKMIKNILEESLEMYINNYEKINGSVILPKSNKKI